MLFPTINFNHWALRINHQILLNRWTVAVIGKFLPSIIALGTGRKNFDNETGLLYNVTLSAILLCATDRCIRIHITFIRQAYTSIGGKNAAGTSTQQPA